MPLITTPERQRQADLCGFKASLVYKSESRTARAVIQRNLVKTTKPKPKVAYDNIESESDGRL